MIVKGEKLFSGFSLFACRKNIILYKRKNYYNNKKDIVAAGILQTEKYNDTGNAKQRRFHYASDGRLLL